MSEIYNSIPEQELGLNQENSTPLTNPDTENEADENYLIPENVASYFFTRFDDPVFQNTLETYCNQSPSPEFVSSIFKQANHLITEYGIDTKLFGDQRYLEPFLLICLQSESLNLLEESEAKDSQKKFLSDFSSILFNKKDDEQDVEDKDSDLERIKQHIDTEKTEQVKVVFEDFSDNSPLADARKKLGITQENERPCEIMVLSVSHLSSDWEEATGLKQPALAFCRLEEEGPRHIICSQSVDMSRFREVIHEYVHVQRDIKLGRNFEANLFWEETMAKFISGAGYGSILQVFRTIAVSTEQPNELLSKFKQAWQSEEGVVDLSKHLTKEFGPLGALYCMAIKPPNYDQIEIPEISNDHMLRYRDFLSFLIKERSKTDPATSEKIADWLRSERFFKDDTIELAFNMTRLEGLAFPPPFDDVLKQRVLEVKARKKENENNQV